MTRYSTEEGLKKLKDELEERTTKIRQEIAKDIKEAKEQGDLSENAEYAAAKSRQRENERRVEELIITIKNTQVVKASSNGNSINVGSKFKVVMNGAQLDFKMVGTHEADPANFMISNESPVGKAFIGKKKGDEIEVETPAGSMKYKIVDIIHD